MNFQEILLLLLLCAIIFLIIWQILGTKKQDDLAITSEIDRMSKDMTNTMMQMQLLLSQRLEQANKDQYQGTKIIGDRLDNASKAVQNVFERLAKVEESNKRIYDIGKDISSLQHILKAPKLRGGLGEHFLGDLLGQIFPDEHFKLQYRFSDGQAVDAVLILKDNILVPIDSKFPLENFLQMITHQESGQEEDMQKARKLFIIQVKKHIDDIANKYIRPMENTLDFALMYIPAENVYYESILKDDGGLVAYAHQKKVFPVSPNSFYIYLQAILMGLRGLQVEKETKNLLATLSGLSREFGKFSEDFRLVGTHIGRSKSAYENSEKRLEKFSDKLEALESISPETLPEAK